MSTSSMQMTVVRLDPTGSFTTVTGMGLISETPRGKTYSYANFRHPVESGCYVRTSPSGDVVEACCIVPSHLYDGVKAKECEEILTSKLATSLHDQSKRKRREYNIANAVFKNFMVCMGVDDLGERNADN